MISTWRHIYGYVEVYVVTKVAELLSVAMSSSISDKRQDFFARFQKKTKKTDKYYGLNLVNI